MPVQSLFETPVASVARGPSRVIMGISALALGLMIGGASLWGQLQVKPLTVHAPRIKPVCEWHSAEAAAESEPSLLMLEAPEPVYAPQPEYPPLGRLARLEGRVRLTVFVARDGAVERVKLMSGHPMLVTAAIDAVRQWRYAPTLLNGRPMRIRTLVTVRFVMPKRESTPSQSATRLV